jgi:hypothetical protein
LRFGSVEVSQVSPLELGIRRGGQEWKMDLSRLVRTNDCVLPYIGNERICTGPPKSPCLECPRGVTAVAWDEDHRRLYFAITTALSWEKPWAIFNYSLATRRFTRFTNTWTAGFSLGTVSPSGQFLAYLKVHHESPAAGCRERTDIEIVDLWNHRVARPSLAFAKSEDVTRIEELRWSSSSILDYVSMTYRRFGCLAVPEARPLVGRIDAGSLSFL